MTQFSGSVKITSKNVLMLIAGGSGFCLCLHPGLLRGIPLYFSEATTITDVVPLEKSRVKHAPQISGLNLPILAEMGVRPLKGLGHLKIQV
jgi:hypothetical protein